MRDAAIDTHRSPARGAGRSRSSGAPPLDDMVGEGPLSRGAPRRGASTSAAVAAQRLGGGRSSGPSAAVRGRPAPGLVSRLRGRLPRFRPVKALMIGTFGVALVGIVANAMVFQRGHHPAPLFGLGRSVDGAGDAAERTAASVPPPAAVAAVEKTGTIPQAPATPADPAPPVAVAAAKPAPVHHAAAKAHREEAAIPATPPKSPVAQAAAPASHPRPGHAAVARAKPEPHGESKGEAQGEAKPDAVAKLLAGPARPAKPENKAAPAAKAAAVPPSHPRHRLAAAAADGAAKAAQPE